MTPVALALAERKVPRYTSYPTAPQFAAAAFDAYLAQSAARHSRAV